MDRTDIQLFLSIVRLSSITKAAELMHFTQSTVSYRLKSMEKELNVLLFFRKKGQRTSELTKYGEQFVPIAEQWAVLYQDTQDLQYFPNNLLTVGAIGSISSTILADVYTAVSNGDTPLRMRVITGYSDEIYKLVESHEADIGFIAEPSQRKNIITTPLFNQKYYVVRYAKYPSVIRRLDPKDLDPKHEIYMYWGGNYDQWHRGLWDTTSMYYACVDTISLLEAFLTDERYWAIVPGSLIRSFPRNANMQIDELNLENPYMRTCYMIKHQNPKPSRIDGIACFEKTLGQVLVNIPDIELV